jgi:hypothetical protein
VSLFGTLFSQVNISRTDTNDEEVVYMKVPITYAQSEKMLTRVREAIDGDRASSSLTLPVMSFEMVGLKYDADRKLHSTGRSVYLNTSRATHLKYQYNPVPYDLSFQLNIWVKNVEDGTKIIEQILPYFTPDFTVQAVLIAELGTKTDVPIILNSVNTHDEYESDFKKNQPIIWTLDFTMKANFWGPIKSAPIILFANTNLRIATANQTAEEAVSNATLANWISVFPGQDANGVATSNASITVPANTILANSDFGYIEVQNGIIDDFTFIYHVDQEFTLDSTIIEVDEVVRPNT